MLAMTQNAAGEWVESSVAEIRYFIYGAALADGSVLGDALLGEAVVTNPALGTEYTPTYDTLTYDEKGMPFTKEYRKGDSTALYYYLTDAFGKITGPAS